MLSREQVLEKLSKVEDPELGLNIVDLGLIYEVDILPAKEGQKPKAGIKMTFTTPACPLINVILQDVQDRLNEIPDTDFDIVVVFDPPWTPERMSQRAKIKMGLI